MSGPQHGPASSPHDLLVQARQAYWQGHPEQAVTLYRRVLEQSPDPAVLGELGNVYFQMGRWQDAARTYARAAERYARRGDRSTVMRLMAIVQRIDPQAARQLQEHLRDLPR
ncbi:MAG: tetratricopeptide repeat protein [Gammaproteobacteria bacterium]|nr:MAG: tetratricopeptide repeat protein [Gammaproteobacteria bacterium]